MSRYFRFRVAVPLIAAALLGAVPAAGAVGQDALQVQDEVTRLFTEADAAFERGEWGAALESYYRITTLSLDRSQLSRASLGMAISYFSMNDRDSARRWIRQALEYDPAREPIDRIYPETFVLIFMEVREERAREAAAVPAPPQPEPQAPEPPAQTPPEAEAPKAEPKPQEPAAPPVQAPPRRQARILGETDWKDKWEIEAHLSSWSLGPVEALFESYITDNLAEEIRDRVLRQLQGYYSLLVQTGYDETIVFDSDGSNFGFGVRFYPKGREGGFSLGLSFEKTHIRLMIGGPVKQTYAPGGSSQVEGSAYIDASPFATHLSFRWEFVPAWRVKPYISLGLGLAALDGEVGYAWTGTFQYLDQQRTLEDDQVLTFAQAEEEADFNIPNVLPFLHLGLGVKGEIVPGLSGIAEAGIWDGFMLRAGVAYRF